MSKRLIRVLIFAIGLAIAYSATSLAIVANKPVRDFVPNILSSRDNTNSITERLNSYTDRNQKLDYLFIGSSNMVRASNRNALEGLEYENISSGSQTPLNSYYLAKRLVDENSAEVILVDTYWHTSTTEVNGTEGTVHLASNFPFSLEWLQMAAAVGLPSAINSTIANGLWQHFWPENLTVDPVEIDTQTTNAPPKLKTANREKVLRRLDPGPVTMSERHLSYFDKLIEHLNQGDTRVVMIRTPVSKELKDSVDNYPQTVEPFVQIAQKHGVEFYDFNSDELSQRLNLELTTDFLDANHLNSLGAGKLTTLLLEILES